MNEIFKLLENKNYWFKKYLSCNEAFIVAMKHAPEIAMDELELFYGNRESLLKIIEGVDQKIQSLLDSAAFQDFEANSEQKTKINYYIREKDSILNRIVELDKTIIASVENVQQETLEKLRVLHKGKKALAKYKTTNKYNQKIDEQV